MLIPVLLAVIFLVFSILNLVPGDTAQLLLGITASAEDIEQLNHELGLDKPFFVRFFDYIFNLIQGDLGSSYKTNIPVWDEIVARFPVTLKLSVLAISITVFIGIPVGMISAVRQYSFMDHICVVSTLTLCSIPSFWLGLMLVLLLSVKFGLLPAMGIGSLQHYVLPSITASSVTLGTVIRMTRSSMLETLRQDYMVTARAKGCSENSAIFNHALRNAMLPIVTTIGVNLGILLGGTFVIETVFTMPGLGAYIVDAIKMRDMPAVMGGIIVLATVFCLINLIVDLFYALIDPRVLESYK
jgi:peptide/nickel transport system permease protein